MSEYHVKYVNTIGNIVEEDIESSDKMSLYNKLKDEHETLISADELGEKKKSIWNINLPFFGRVKSHDKIIFIRNLASMIDAGLALSRALAVIEKETHNKKFKSIIVELEKNVNAGFTLSDSLKKFPNIFSSLMVSMVKAGEESGSLSQSLKVVSGQMESSFQLTRKVKGAMMYPMIIIGAMAVIGMLMLRFVVPTLAATFKDLGTALPISTRIIIASSDFLKDHFIVAILGIIIIVSTFIWALHTARGKRILEFVVLKLPVIGVMVKEVNSARTARTLSSLLTAGVDVVVATHITAEVLQNSYYKSVLAVVEEKIQKGLPIAGVFAGYEKLYPPFVGEMIAVGEETGQLANMLLGVATFYETEIDQKTKDLSSIIEPVLMVFIGLVVGIFAISMISPIYSLGANIN